MDLSPKLLDQGSISHSWNGTEILQKNQLEALQGMKGGAAPKKYRDPFSVKSFNARMARRKRVEAAARELRMKHKAEVEL
jgi:hypothetical protein